MTDTEDYDLIFAALKNPIRRQILVFLEQKGETSFTDIQNAVDINDTGLLSYHLKELNLLIEQSRRGKYQLSEIGQTSMVLFHKVEHQQEQTTKMVQKEVDNYLTRHFWSSLILAGLVVLNYFIPVSVDIFASVNTISDSFTSLHLAGLHLLGFFGMTICLVLFVIYDRHYHSKKLKTNILHTTIFAVSISFVVLYCFFSTYNFTQNTTAMGATPNLENSLIDLQWTLGIVRTAAYLVTAPLVAFAFDNLVKKR